VQELQHLQDQTRQDERRRYERAERKMSNKQTAAADDVWGRSCASRVSLFSLRQTYPSHKVRLVNGSVRSTLHKLITLQLPTV